MPAVGIQRPSGDLHTQAAGGFFDTAGAAFWADGFVVSPGPETRPYGDPVFRQQRMHESSSRSGMHWNYAAVLPTFGSGGEAFHEKCRRLARSFILAGRNRCKDGEFAMFLAGLAD